MNVIFRTGRNDWVPILQFIAKWGPLKMRSKTSRREARLPKVYSGQVLKTREKGGF